MKCSGLLERPHEEPFTGQEMYVHIYYQWITLNTLYQINENRGKYMKKCIAILLVIIMCFGMAACGKISNSDEAKDSPKAEPEVVQINRENWSEYFDLCIAANLDKNDNEEIVLVSFGHRMVLKPEYNGAVTAVQLTVGYFCSDGFIARCSYDSETGEVTVSEPYDESQLATLPYASMERRVNEGETYFTLLDIERGVNITRGCFQDSFSVDGTQYSVDAALYNNVELNIFGQLTITK